MKIQGPNNQMKVNPYQNQIRKQTSVRTEQQAKADQLQISDQAKKMQEAKHVQPEREARVEAIKQQVETGNYSVDAEQTAVKLLQFFKK